MARHTVADDRTASRPRRPSAATDSRVGRWLVDAERSTLRVSVRVGLLATVHGTFTEVAGQVELATNCVRSRVDVTVGTASLSSGSTCMDALLHGAGVVDSVRNPSIGFVSRAIRPGPASGEWLLDGLLATAGAILDVTLEMTEPVEHDGALLFRATGTMSSKDAVRLLSQPGVEKVLGRRVTLDLVVVAVAARDQHRRDRSAAVITHGDLLRSAEE